MSRSIRLATRFSHSKDYAIKLTEFVLAGVTFVGVSIFSVMAIASFIHKDWARTSTMYEFITVILLILLSFEVVRLIIVHSISVAMELMLLIIARKMLYPDIRALDLIYCSIAFTLIVCIYYIYELKPLKSLDDLTK